MIEADSDASVAQKPQVSPIRPRSSRLRKNAMAACAILSLVCALCWAVVPLRRPPLSVLDLASTVDRSEPAPMIALDPAAFRAPLWVAPPTPPEPEAVAAPPPPPPPPLRLQLLTIVTEDNVRKAMLYDPDTDRLLTLVEGEAVGSRRVERVTAREVAFRDGTLMQTLALRSDVTDAPSMRGGR